MFKLFFLSVYLSSFLSVYDNGIAMKANFIEVDNLENIYAVTDLEIYKFDKNLILQNTYSQSAFGKIYSLDVSNSFKILVFFKDFNSIFFLDNNLSEISKIDFSISDFTDIQLVSSSLQSDFWIYDNSEKRIFLINEKFEIQQKSKFLGKYIKNDELIDLIENNNKLYLGIKDKGVIVFDSNANFDEFVEFNLTNSFSFYYYPILYFLEDITHFEFETNKVIRFVLAKNIDNSDLVKFYITDNAIDYKTKFNKVIILTKDSLNIKNW